MLSFTRPRVRRLLVVGATLSASVCGNALGEDLALAWSREIMPAGVSSILKEACSSPTGLLVVASVSAPVRDAPFGYLAVRLNDDGTQIQQRELSTPEGKKGLRDVRACVDTGDGYLLIGASGRDNLAAWWLAPDLETTGSLELIHGESVVVWGLTTLADGRFAAVVDDRYRPSILFFDRKSVARILPDWSADKVRLLYDVAVIGDDVFICGIEGDPGSDPNDPSFDNPQILVATFGADGSERSTARFAGQTCRLFPEENGSMALLHQSTGDRLSSLQLTHLDRKLMALGSKTVLDKVIFLFKLEAARAGRAFAVFRPFLIEPAIDVVGPDPAHSVIVEAEMIFSTVIRSAGRKVYLVSPTTKSGGAAGRLESGLRVSAFDVR